MDENKKMIQRLEIKRFQFKLVCVEFSRIGLLSLINMHNLRAKKQ